jgi:hypothetical protein
MSPWLSVVLFGLVIFGFAWLSPGGRREEEAGGGSDPAYDRLLEDLETENRELLDAVAKFKQEQDETVRRLVEQIAELERRMESLNGSASAAPADPIAGAGSPPAQAPQEEAAPAVAASGGEPPNAMQPENAEQAAKPAPVGPLSIRERYADLLTMHAKGRSIEQIAKAAGMNKGEVQLILQLARREEEQLA